MIECWPMQQPESTPVGWNRPCASAAIGLSGRFRLTSFIAPILLVCVACPVMAGPRKEPDYRRIHSALQRPVSPSRLAVTRLSVSAIRPARSQAVVKSGQRDSVWNGLLIGAGMGAASGYVWGRSLCGANDSECFAIAGTVGVLGGTAIGATVGAIIDALHH
jgi:hypothetical protein